MNKIINIIIISFFSVLSGNDLLLYSLYIPILYFLGLKNKRNLILIIPIGLISTFLLNKILLVILIINYLIILIYIFVLKKVILKYDNVYLEILLIFISNIISFLFYNKNLYQNQIVLLILITVTSLLIYCFFRYNFEASLKNKNKIFIYPNIEVIMFIISVFGSLKINNTFSFLLSLYFIMYLSSSESIYHSLFLSLILSVYDLLYLKINYAFILPFISSLYLLNGLWSSIILISICFIIWIGKQAFIADDVLQGIIYTAIFFEFVKGSVVLLNSKEEEIYKNAYSKNVDVINKQLLTFAEFLDIYNKDFALRKDYVKKMNEAIDVLKHNYCHNCYLKESCYKTNKNILYKYFSEIIMYSKRSDYSKDTFIHLNKCPYVKEMIHMAGDLNKRFEVNNVSIKTNSMIGITNGISNILKLYAISNSLKQEMDYNNVYKIKKILCSYGFNVCYFEPLKLLINDFEIEVGLRGENFNDIYLDVAELCRRVIKTGVSVVFKKTEKGKLYFNIIPKINYSIDFGYCNFSGENNYVSGDNCLIKDVTSGKSISVICDGMGKGYEANDISFNTLRLIEKIMESDIGVDTALQILNTFYFLQEYAGKYTTLDLVEIDKIEGKAVFFKLGAATTYYFNKNGKCRIIENQSLPFGLEEIVEEVSLDVNDGDLIVMSSDGVFDSLVNKEKIEEYIKGVLHMPSQKIVYEISNMVKENKRIDDDDMSIIVMKLCKV